MATQIAFSGPGAELTLVEEGPEEVAALLAEGDALVRLQRIPAAIGEHPIATWVDPARAAFPMEPIEARHG